MAGIACPFCNRTFVHAAALIQHQRDTQTCSSAVARGVKDGSIGVVDTEKTCVVNRGDAAAALGGAALVGGLLAGAAALSAATLMPQVVERYTIDADTSGGEQNVEEKIIEFERKLPFKGFSASHLFPNEPNFKHRDGNGLALASKEDLLLPTGWIWADEWHVLQGTSANQSGTDTDGWMYAFNWGSEYAASPTMTHCVRQRIWSRTRACTSVAKFTQEEIESAVLSLSLKSAAAEASREVDCAADDGKGKQAAKETMPSGEDSAELAALRELFEKNGLADIFERATTELGVKTVADLKWVEKEDLDALQWLTPVAKRKLLRFMADTLV
jgi:hypothetical protein